MTDNTPHHDDQGKGRSDGSISRRNLPMTGTLMTGAALAASGVTLASLISSAAARATCTAGRASFLTGRRPVRSALSVVVVPGDPNCGVLSEERLLHLLFGKWHLGEQSVSARARAGLTIMPSRTRSRGLLAATSRTIP